MDAPSNPLGSLPAILHVEDLAHIMGVSVHGAAEACRRGRVPACKIGRRWVVRREALLDLLKRQERRHRAPKPQSADPGRVLRALPHRRRAAP